MYPERPSALITGGSRGIGYGIAKHLASHGWDLTLCARNEETLANGKIELEGFGGTISAFPCDLSDAEVAETTVDHHRSVFGNLNLLVLAAGVGSAAPLEGYPRHRFDKQFAVNIGAPFAMVSKALPLLRQAAKLTPSRGGRIIALTSIEGCYPAEGLSAYAASKAALISLVRSVNIESGPHGVIATAISPAFVDTDMSSWVADRIAVDTMITVDDVVRVVELILALSPNTVLPHVVLNRAGASPYAA